MKTESQQSAHRAILKKWVNIQLTHAGICDNFYNNNNCWFPCDKNT